MTDDLEFRRYGAEQARAIRGTVETVYRDAYSAAITSGDPFDSPEQFMTRFEAYTGSGRGFDMVIAYLDGEPVGQTWGWPLGGDTAWWRGLVSEPEQGFTNEDGTRTFALSEIMVRRQWTGRGFAHALHDTLLGDRDETRATLLVEVHNNAAYRAYTAWGWRRVAQLRPGWPDAPMFDVLILPLPIAPAQCRPSQQHTMTSDPVPTGTPPDGGPHLPPPPTGPAEGRNQ